MKIPLFFKNVFTLSIGNFLGQLLSLIALPVFASLYNPAEFGIYATFINTCQLVIIFSTLKYDKAIVMPNTQAEADQVALVAFVAVAFFTALSVLGVGLVGLSSLSLTFPRIYLVLLPLSVFSFGSWSIMIYWMQKKEKFKQISIYSLVQTTLTISITILWKWLALPWNGLIFGWLFSSFILVVSYWLSIRQQWPSLRQQLTWQKLQPKFKEYADFPKYTLFYDVVNTSMIVLLPILITHFYSEHECGLFSMAYRVLMIPIIVVGNPITQVFLINANKEYNESHHFDSSYRKVFLQLLAMGTVIYVTSYFIGDMVLNIMLGNKWKGIGEYIEIMSFWFFFEFIVIVFRNSVYMITKHQHVGLWLQMANATISLSCLYYFSNQTIRQALIAFVITMGCFWVINILLTYRLSKLQPSTA